MDSCSRGPEWKPGIKATNQGQAPPYTLPSNCKKGGRAVNIRVGANPDTPEVIFQSQMAAGSQVLLTGRSPVHLAAVWERFHLLAPEWIFI